MSFKFNILLQISLTSASMYLLALSGASTLLSMYGLIALFRHVFKYMHHQKLIVKFLAIQLTIIIHNVQPLIFGTIASKFGVPECVESRGPKVRASSKFLHLLYYLLLSCQLIMTVTSCFANKVIRDLELTDHLCINPICRIRLIFKLSIDTQLAQVVCTS